MPPRLTVWVTDHMLSQRVSAALKLGFGDDALLGFAGQVSEKHIAATPVHIGYGIMRGMTEVTRLAEEQRKPWFIVDLGYTGPGHFQGNYRIAYRGTQSPFDARFQASELEELAPWKSGGEAALLCPPSDHVCKFFGLNEEQWIEDAARFAKNLELPAKLRRKGDPEDLEVALEKAACVITFNSAVGWRALKKGIPAFSDVKRSTVGSWHGEKACSLEALKSLSREALFGFMKASQLSLLEIQQGKIYGILSRYVPELFDKEIVRSRESGNPISLKS